MAIGKTILGTLVTLAVVAVVITLGRANAQIGTGPTAFTYQGRLLDASNVPVTGTCAMTFTLHSASSGGAQIGSAIAQSPSLVDGYFSVSLDFGASPFDGSDRWLQVESGCTGETFDRLAVNAVPYAIHALNVPTEMTPTYHLQSWVTITGTPDTYTPTAHTQAWSTITSQPSTYTPTYHMQGWSTITGTPDTYTATSHSHAYVTGTGVTGYAAVWSDSKTIEQATNMIVGGRIAVGTSSPASYSGLHIRKANDAAIHLTDSIVSDSSNSTWLIDVTNGGSGSGGSAVLSIGTTTESGGSYSEKFRISRDGNVTVYGNVSPGAQNTYDLGTSSYYWANVHYHTLVSHSLVTMTDKIRLRDGREMATCTDALMALSGDPSKSESGGTLHMDYLKIPEVAYVPAVDYVDEKGNVVTGNAGANLDMMISLVLCAARETADKSKSLDAKTVDLEARIKKLEDKVKP